MPDKRCDSDCVISVLQPKNFVIKQTVKRSVFAGFVLQGNGKWGKARCDAVLTPSGVSRPCPMELASTLISSEISGFSRRPDRSLTRVNGALHPPTARSK